MIEGRLLSGGRLLVAVLSGWALLALLWPAALDAMLVDDAWYYLRTARNIVDGFGVSFDREESFNGFHPLWMALLVPVASLSADPEVFGRSALLVQVALAGGGGLLWARALDLGERGLVAGALLVLNPWAMKVLVCGQESALAFMLLALVALAARRGGWRFGVMCGLAVLARLDLAPLVLVYALASAWLTGHRRVSAAAGTLVPFAVTIAPWIAWSLMTQGTMVPVSAATKVEFARLVPLHLAAAGAAAGLVSGVLLWRSLRPTSPTMWWVIALAAVEVGRVVALRETNGVSIWYLFALWPAALAVVTRILEAPRLRIVVSVVWLVGAVVAWSVRLDGSSHAVASASREMGQWLRDNTPPETRVAGWDIGAAAAWSNRSFRNLEGLATSWRFKREVLDRRALPAFLAGDSVDVVAQYFARDHLERGVRASGLDPTRWHVAWQRDVEMRSITSRAKPWRFTFVVLDRTGPGPTVAELARQR